MTQMFVGQLSTVRFSGFAAAAALITVLFATYQQPGDAARARKRRPRQAVIENPFGDDPIDPPMALMQMETKTSSRAFPPSDQYVGDSEKQYEKLLMNTGMQVETQFLIVSSPKMQKITYTRLAKFKSATSRTFALIDSGLKAPMGIALNRKTGDFYVADIEAKKIYCYGVMVDKSDPENPTLITSGLRIDVLQGHPFKWVSVDDHGNLWYTATDTNDINKVEKDVLAKLKRDEFRAKSLMVVNAKVMAANSAAKAAKANRQLNHNPTDAPNVLPRVYQMYESKLNAHVSQPGMLLADGPDLFWTNTANGTKAGSVVQGYTDPFQFVNIGEQKKGVQPFPAEALTLSTDSAYGLAVTGGLILYSSNSSAANTGAVYCVNRHGSNKQPALKMVDNLQAPRGLTFDNDQTVYVADQVSGKIWSFPVGRLMENAPLTPVVDLVGAYGITMFSKRDPAWFLQTSSIGGYSGAHSSRLHVAVLMLAVAGVKAMCTLL